MSTKSSMHSLFSSSKLALRTFFKKAYAKIASLFQPEEVEVTFQVKGKNITYTYTKVQQKQVA